MEPRYLYFTELRDMGNISRKRYLNYRRRILFWYLDVQVAKQYKLLIL